MPLKAISKTLTPNGFLFLTTPNLKSWDAKLLSKYWYGYKKIPEHVIFFSPESIKYALENNGFEVVKIKTWGFERDVNFLVKKISLYLPILNRPLSFLVKFLKIGKKSLYLPVTDMMVVAKKLHD